MDVQISDHFISMATTPPVHDPWDACSREARVRGAPSGETHFSYSINNKCWQLLNEIDVFFYLKIHHCITCITQQYYLDVKLKTYWIFIKMLTMILTNDFHLFLIYLFIYKFFLASRLWPLLPNILKLVYWKKQQCCHNSA